MQGEWMLMTQPDVLTGKTLDRFRVWYDGFLSGTDRGLAPMLLDSGPPNDYLRGHLCGTAIRMKGCLK